MDEATGQLMRHLVQRERRAVPVLMPRLAGRFEPVAADQAMPELPDADPGLAAGAGLKAAPTTMRADVPASSGIGDAQPRLSPDLPARRQDLAAASPGRGDENLGSIGSCVGDGDGDGPGDARHRLPASGPTTDTTVDRRAPTLGAAYARDDLHVLAPQSHRVVPQAGTVAAPWPATLLRAAPAATPAPWAPSARVNAASMPSAEASPVVGANASVRPGSADGDFATAQTAEPPLSLLRQAPATEVLGIVQAGLPAAPRHANLIGKVHTRGALSAPTAPTALTAAAGTGVQNLPGDASRMSSLASEHTVHVTIGRIELRMPTAAGAAPARRNAGTPTALSLADYLQRRGDR